MRRIDEVTDGVHRLSGGGINFYIIDEGGHLTLVDAGLPGHWSTFATWLRRTGRAPRDIQAVLLTHRHSDHLGFARHVRDESGASVHLHVDDIDGAGAPGPAGIPPRIIRNAWRPGTITRVGSWIAHGITRSVVPTDVEACRDGQRLDVPGSPQVVHVPGHTPGSAAYVFADHRVVCTGDALVTLDAATGQRGVGISPTGFNVDDDLALASLGRLEQLDGMHDSVLLPGHGAPYMHGIASAVSAARAIGADW